MASKVQPIAGNEVVDVLTRLRERATRGEIDELAFVARGAADMVGHVGTSSDAVRVLGLVTLLSYEVAASAQVQQL